jgi:putative membrane protein
VNVLPRGRAQRLLFIASLALFGLSCINPPYPQFFVLEHIPTLAAIAVLVVVERRVGISALSYSLLAAFFLLHVLGARYLYSYVPYDEWSEALFGVTISDAFGFRRNHYDRLVHFLYGVLVAVPVYRFQVRWLKLTPVWSAAFALQFILATGAVYELAEWLVAITMAPDWAEAYNGQQGDVWDPQRDMLLAVVGAMLSLATVLAFGAGRRARKNLRDKAD